MEKHSDTQSLPNNKSNEKKPKMYIQGNFSEHEEEVPKWYIFIIKLQLKSL